MRILNKLMAVAAIMMCLSSALNIAISTNPFSRTMAVITFLIWLAISINWTLKARKSAKITFRFDLHPNTTEATADAIRKFVTNDGKMDFIELNYKEENGEKYFEIICDRELPPDLSIRAGHIMGCVELGERIGKNLGITGMSIDADEIIKKANEEKGPFKAPKDFDPKNN